MKDWQKAALLVAATGGIILSVALVARPPLGYLEAGLIAVVALFVLVLGIYHLTHEGLPSGIMELGGFVMLAAAAVMSVTRR